MKCAVVTAFFAIVVGVVILKLANTTKLDEADLFDHAIAILSKPPLRAFTYSAICKYLTSEGEGGAPGDSAKAFLRMNGLPWRPAVPTENVSIVLFHTVAELKAEGITDRYYTGNNVPPSEHDPQETLGVDAILNGLRVSSPCYTDLLAVQESAPRDFDHDKLMSEAWTGFSPFGYHEIAHASNGDFAKYVLEERLALYDGIPDVLGAALTESVMGMFLTYDTATDIFVVDCDDMAHATPITGFAALGGRAELRYDRTIGNYGALRTSSITYNGTQYFPSKDALIPSDSTYRGWRFAEKALLASLVARLNLIMHVKNVHLELAAPLQAVTINSFMGDVEHPFRRMMGPFIHRAIQVTNKNFDILYTYRVAEFSLAPLPMEQQIALMKHFIDLHPLNTQSLDMIGYATAAGMLPEFSQRAASGEPKNAHFFWTWHYRAAKVQELYKQLITCWLSSNYGADWQTKVIGDARVQTWFESLKHHLPSARHGETTLTVDSLLRVTSTMMVWVSWIHEDVGHSAASFVYNPVHTPMMVPLDGHGVIYRPFRFNINAYRQFVFLQRIRMLDPAPPQWFGSEANDSQCWADLQSSLRHLGATDDAFSQCGRTGFYSCVQDVETGVSS